MSRRKKRSRGAPSGPPLLSTWLPHWAALGIASLWIAISLYEFLRRGVKLNFAVWPDFLSLIPRLGRILSDGLAWDLALVMGMIFLFDRFGRVLCVRLGVAGEGAGPLRIGLGAGAASLLLLGLGLVRLWRPPLLQGLFYCGLVWAGVYTWKYPAPRSRDGVLDQNAFGLEEWAAVLLLVCAGLMNLLATVVPEIFYDSLVYHLALPQLWLHRGAIVPTPENVYSGIPFGLQMIFGWALALSGENLTALVHAAFGAGTAWALWDWGRRFATSRTGILAAMLFYVCPVALYASWHSGVDLAGSFYSILALYAVCRSLESGEDGSGPPWAVTAGILTGFAMSTKYNAIPIGGVLVAVHYFLRRRPRESIHMFAAASAVLAPWLIKNLLFYGNPVYPFLHGLLGWVRPQDWGAFLEAAGSRNLAVAFGSGEGFRSLLAAPWIFSYGNWPAGDWPGPAFILLAPLAILFRWTSAREEEALPSSWSAALLMAGGGYVVWVLASHLVRYALPSFPYLALVAALAVERGGLHRYFRRGAWIIAVFSCVFNFEVAYRQSSLIGQWAYLKEGQKKAEYLKSQRTTYGLPYYAAMEFIRTNTPPEAKVLFLGESRAFYCPRDFIAATLFDTNPFWQAVAQAQDSADLHRRVRALGVTHVFLSARQMLYRRASATVLPRALARKPAFADFWERYLDKLWEERVDHGTDPRWMTVYRLRATPNPDSASRPENPTGLILEYIAAHEKPDGTL